ncbi:response regulator [Cohnella sp. GCM10020058]|uniref:response regulator transcription factor n=1 Tax=Cohnella sp. GCM10020058 TaxID=3317330 RepID=UPI00362C3C4E
MMRILIAEDEPLIRRGIVGIVEEAWPGRFELVQAADGTEALELLERFAPDLVITDIYMPGMTGLELIEAAQDRELRGRFVILSGYDDFNLVKKGLQLQVLDYLLKPVDREELTELLERIAGEVEREGRVGLPLSGTAGSASIAAGIRFIEGNYNREIALEHLAQAIHLHPNYVSLLFKRETGKTFVQYLQQYRIAKAQELIGDHPDLAFDKVALLVGYDSPPHFFKLFKKMTGKTPGQYRNG